MFRYNLPGFLALILLGCVPSIFGLPADPAAAAAEPAASSPPAPVAAAPQPAVSADPAPAVSKAAPLPTASSVPQQGGIITEHKNPDGSTITVTRYNGPLPASAFQSPFTGLHDSSLLYLNNLYQTQLLQLQALRNIQLLNYNYLPLPLANAYVPTYRSNLPYMYSSGGPFFSPFFGGYPFGYPSYGQPAAKTV